MYNNNPVRSSQGRNQDYSSTGGNSCIFNDAVKGPRFYIIPQHLRRMSDEKKAHRMERRKIKVTFHPFFPFIFQFVPAHQRHQNPVLNPSEYSARIRVSFTGIAIFLLLLPASYLALLPGKRYTALYFSSWLEAWIVSRESALDRDVTRRRKLVQASGNEIQIAACSLRVLGVIMFPY